MEVDEIRFNLLSILYEKYYEYGERPISTDNIIIELNFTDDSQSIYDNILYLNERDLIWAQKLENEKYYSLVKINEKGISLVERVLALTLEKIQDEVLKEKLRLVLNDANPSSRMRRFLDLTKSYSTLAGLVGSLVSRLLKKA
ncbi:MAG TPA: hypothetical protein VH415_15275 [Nitrososphaeraceae archaeon]|jgi:hypothetical protein